MSRRDFATLLLLAFAGFMFGTYGPEGAAFVAGVFALIVLGLMAVMPGGRR